jgi:hypothetical protein
MAATSMDANEQCSIMVTTQHNIYILIIIHIVVCISSFVRYRPQLPGTTVVSPCASGAMHMVIHYGQVSTHLAWNTLTTEGCSLTHKHHMHIIRSFTQLAPAAAYRAIACLDEYVIEALRAATALSAAAAKDPSMKINNSVFATNHCCKAAIDQYKCNDITHTRAPAHAQTQDSDNDE